MANGILYLEGFFYKSPPPTKINFQLKQSWKRRFIVLQNTTGRPQLSYYEDEKNTTCLGVVTMNSVHEVCKITKDHRKWETVQRLWGPIASNAILLKTADRDYFLVADEGVDAEHWFESLKNTLSFQSPRHTYQLDMSSTRLPILLDHFENMRTTNNSLLAQIPQMDTNGEKEMSTCGPNKVEPTRELPSAIQNSTEPMDSTNKNKEGNMLLPNNILDKKEEEVGKNDCSREVVVQPEDEKDSFEENNPMIPLPGIKEKSEVYTPLRSFGETYRVLLKEKKQANVSIDIPSSELLNNIEFAEVENSFHVVGFQELHSNLKVHIGDKLEAINDLRILAVEDIKMFAQRSIKTTVTLLIRRLPRANILHLKREDVCDDWGFDIEGLKVIRINPKMVALEEDECQAILGKDGEEWRVTEVNFLVQNLDHLETSLQKEIQIIINNNLEFYLILQPAEFLQKIIQASKSKRCRM